MFFCLFQAQHGTVASGLMLARLATLCPPHPNTLHMYVAFLSQPLVVRPNFFLSPLSTLTIISSLLHLFSRPFPFFLYLLQYFSNTTFLMNSNVRIFFIFYSLYFLFIFTCFFLFFSSLSPFFLFFLFFCSFSFLFPSLFPSTCFPYGRRYHILSALPPCIVSSPRTFAEAGAGTRQEGKCLGSS